MCGISAIIDFGSGQCLPGAVLHMHAQIPHRGPDGEGFLFVDSHGRPFTAGHAEAVKALTPATPWRFGAGFRWLKIQDLGATAVQPMGSQDRMVWVLFNGEIYNFHALRVTLQRDGHCFTTQSDTEVILAAYRQWGPACFARFSGMWAMVIVDLYRQRVTLCRDRFGIKPLFYRFEDSRLLLASESKQIVAASRGQIRANLSVVSEFLQGRRLHHGEETFFEGIVALPPATYAEIDLAAGRVDSLVCKPYWNLADFLCPDPHQAPPFQEACAVLDELLRTSVAAHAAAQVPIGSLLSGGLDSSTITAILHARGAHRDARIPSFSLVLPGQQRLDESPYIDAVVTHFGMPNFKTTVDATWVREHMPRIAWTQEEPLIGMPWVAQYRTYQLAAEHGVRVVLDGQGADEILAGYPRHQYTLLWDWLQRWRLGALARESLALIRVDPGFLTALARQAVRGPLRRRLMRQPAHQPYQWLSDACKVLLDTAHADGRQGRPGGDLSRLQHMLYTDVHSGNLKTVLAVGDRNAMAHAIESRVPYLDHRIVEFVFQLPEHYKTGAGLRKRLLRHVAGRYLPASVVQRRDRIGFGVPQAQWLKEDFRAALGEAAHSAVLRTTPLVDHPRLTQFIAGFYAGAHADAEAIWRVYALWQWAEAYHIALG